MTREITEFFKTAFHTTPAHVARAPGRLELLGNHTDYNEGLVMALAVDRYVFMASSPRQDGKIELASTAFSGREIFYADRLEKSAENPWSNYVKGVLFKLRERGVRFGGANIAIHGTIPLGAGMSSSAALEVATALTFRRLYPFAISETALAPAPRKDAQGALPPLSKSEKMTLAKICQAAEREFVGANVGLLDQISSLFGREGHVIQIDCQHLTVGHEPMAPGIAVVVCDSGVKHDLAAGEYNELRAHCESAAKTLGVPSLRAVTPQDLERNKERLAQRDYQCAKHVTGEIQRVVHGERALREGDIEQFGQYLFQSHESSRDWFRNSCPELDILVEAARGLPGCLGARLTGGGFGGATINLVRAEQAPAFQKAIALAYQEKTGRKLEPLICKIVNGAE